MIYPIAIVWGFMLARVFLFFRDIDRDELQRTSDRDSRGRGWVRRQFRDCRES